MVRDSISSYFPSYVARLVGLIFPCLGIITLAPIVLRSSLSVAWKLSYNGLQYSKLENDDDYGVKSCIISECAG